MSFMWNPETALREARGAERASRALAMPASRQRLRADVWELLLAANLVVWTAALYWLVG